MVQIKFLTFFALVFFIQVVKVHGEKTNIAVQFKNEADIISGTFALSSSRISMEMVEKFTTSLNEYMPFFQFIKESSNLKITFILADTSLDKRLRLIVHFHDKAVFLDKFEIELFNHNEYYNYKGNADIFIDMFQTKWDNWLRENYNLMLVSRFFKKIPIQTLSSEYYYALPDNSSRFIILPFDTCMLHLNVLGGSKFWIHVEYKDTLNTIRKKPIDNAIIYGVVDDSMPDKNVEFNGDVTFDITSLADINAFQKGSFKILYYERVQCVSITSPSDY